MPARLAAATLLRLDAAGGAAGAIAAPVFVTFRVGSARMLQCTQTLPGASMEFADKVAVITGAASGIGRAVALTLASRGVRAVAMVDMGDGIDGVAADVNAKAGREVAYPYRGNTTDEAFRASVFDSISKRFGLVSMCVPAAGITRDDLAVRVDKITGKARIYPVDKFKLVVDVNLIAPVYWALEMIGRIAEDRAARGLKRWVPTEGMQGAIVFIGSVSSQGNRGQISYASTKAGLEGAAATIMQEAIFHGVRCGLIHPGYTDTPMVRALGDDFVSQEHPAVHPIGTPDPSRRNRRRDLLHARQLGGQRRVVGRRRLARAGVAPAPMEARRRGFLAGIGLRAPRSGAALRRAVQCAGDPGQRAVAALRREVLPRTRPRN